MCILVEANYVLNLETSSWGLLSGFDTKSSVVMFIVALVIKCQNSVSLGNVKT